MIKDNGKLYTKYELHHFFAPNFITAAYDNLNKQKTQAHYKSCTLIHTLLSKNTYQVYNQIKTVGEIY